MPTVGNAPAIDEGDPAGTGGARVGVAVGGALVAVAGTVVIVGMLVGDATTVALASTVELDVGPAVALVRAVGVAVTAVLVGVGEAVGEVVDVALGTLVGVDVATTLRRGSVDCGESTEKSIDGRVTAPDRMTGIAASAPPADKQLESNTAAIAPPITRRFSLLRFRCLRRVSYHCRSND